MKDANVGGGCPRMDLQGKRRPAGLDRHAHALGTRGVSQGPVKAEARRRQSRSAQFRPGQTTQMDGRARGQHARVDPLRQDALALGAPDVGATLAQIINDANIEAHKAFPDRFVGGVEVSIRSPELALKELNRVAGKPGMKAVHLPTSIEGKDYLFEQRYAPFLARCEQLRYPLLFHPLDWDETFTGEASNPGWQHRSPRLRISTTRLVFRSNTPPLQPNSSLPARSTSIRKLDILWPHMGGIFPYIAGRIDHGLWMRKFKLKHPFRYYLRRFHYDTLTYYPETMHFLINLVGFRSCGDRDGQLCHHGRRMANAMVERMNLPAADREKILWGNAARLLRL